MISRLFAILALVLLNGFFVAAEFSLVRSRRTRLEAMVRSGDKLARIAMRATSNISRVLSASQLGVTLASLGLGWIAEKTLAGIFEGLFARLPFAVEVSLSVTIAGIVAYTVLTYLHVVLGELTPKAAALNHPERFAKWLAPPLLLFGWVMSPFIWVLNRSANGILHTFGQSTDAMNETVHSPEELRLLVEQAQESGSLERSDARMLGAVFEFSEKNAREVMTPRTEIIAFPVDATLPEVLKIVEESGVSRYPIYEETIDDIIGMVLSKDLLRVLIPVASGGASATNGASPNFSLREMMRPVHMIPGSKEVEDVLADFKRLKIHMAVVLDEYDTSEDSDAPVRTRAGETLVKGETNIGELNERFGLDIPEDDATTIGGYVFGVLGRLPQAGDRVIAGGAIFTVREMEGRKIDSLAVDLHSAGDRRAHDRE
ncbi:MAG TPA: hemolysin family protein, partial [Gemmatimonadaceae bacterium]|nr:hemolysin family protein [Gemmatimonadaceae bacterium]